MYSVARILLILIKAYVLLLGIVMLIGGGMCLISIPFVNAENTLLATITTVGMIALLSLLLFLIKIDFSKQVRWLILLTSGLFLVGGGLCVTDSSTDMKAMSGLLVINIAIALTGYILIRWMLTKKTDRKS